MSAPYTLASSSTLATVLRRYADWAETQGPTMLAGVAIYLNRHLDELLSGDAFGTEGQCDPRGDRRE